MNDLKKKVQQTEIFIFLSILCAYSRFFGDVWPFTFDFISLKEIVKIFLCLFFRKKTVNMTSIVYLTTVIFLHTNKKSGYGRQRNVNQRKKKQTTQQKKKKKDGHVTTIPSNINNWDNINTTIAYDKDANEYCIENALSRSIFEVVSGGSPPQKPSNEAKGHKPSQSNQSQIQNRTLGLVHFDDEKKLEIKGKMTQYANNYELGDRVLLSKDREGIVKYIGIVSGISESTLQYGIELIAGSLGEHNGTYQGKNYFQGTDQRCIFVDHNNIRRKMTNKDNSSPNRQRRQESLQIKFDVGLLHIHIHFAYKVTISIFIIIYFLKKLTGKILKEEGEELGIVPSNSSNNSSMEIIYGVWNLTYDDGTQSASRKIKHSVTSLLFFVLFCFFLLELMYTLSSLLFFFFIMSTCLCKHGLNESDGKDGHITINANGSNHWKGGEMMIRYDEEEQRYIIESDSLPSIYEVLKLKRSNKPDTNLLDAEYFDDENAITKIGFGYRQHPKRNSNKRADASEQKKNEYQVGDLVILTQDREGYIRYIGEVHYAQGIFYGIELTGGSTGTHKGTVKGKEYFT
ncbi:hypothetical protein RFI_17774, partial [Reticulomyxa filosa]